MNSGRQYALFDTVGDKMIPFDRMNETAGEGCPGQKNLEETIMIRRYQNIIEVWNDCLLLYQWSY